MINLIANSQKFNKHSIQNDNKALNKCPTENSVSVMYEDFDK